MRNNPRDSVEVSAKTVDEAVEVALKELGAGRDEVTVEVLSQGRPGFLGFGAQPARVRVTRLRPEDTAERTVREVVDTLLKLLGVQCYATLAPPSREAPGIPAVQISGEDAGLLIGRRGETLRALQFLVNLVLARRTDGRVQAFVDVEHYKERRYQSLRSLALRVAEKVAATGRPVTLEPMPPNERRIIHLALADHPRVTTQSVGEGDARKVTVLPRRPSRPRG